MKAYANFSATSTTNHEVLPAAHAQQQSPCRTLRPDVESVVARWVATMERRNIDPLHNPWRTYSDFKSELSRTCGWHCRGGGFDQSQFDMGIRAFCGRAGL